MVTVPVPLTPLPPHYPLLRPHYSSFGEGVVRSGIKKTATQKEWRTRIRLEQKALFLSVFASLPH